MLNQVITAVVQDLTLPHIVVIILSAFIGRTAWMVATWVGKAADKEAKAAKKRLLKHHIRTHQGRFYNCTNCLELSKSHLGQVRTLEQKLSHWYQ